MAFSFGNVNLKNGIMLAPMAGVTDYSFRLLCKSMGAEYMVTEMISAKAMHYKDEKTAVLARIRCAELPIAIQIFGSEPEIMAEAAGLLESGDYKGCTSEALPSAIDINMGCPVRKIVNNGEGSALMKNPQRIYEIVDAVKKAIKLPVTVKIRSGWDIDSINAVECAIAAQEGGASMICVHGRTREQMYQPPVDWEIIAKVKQAVKIPVVGNGGIYTSQDAIEMKRQTGCDGVMVARGAQGNPFIFAHIKAAFEGTEYIPMSQNRRLDFAIKHAQLLCEDKGEAVAVCEIRKHLAWYVKGMPGAPQFRDIINHTQTLDEIIKHILLMKNEE